MEEIRMNKFKPVGVDASFAYSCCNRQSLNSTSNIDSKREKIQMNKIKQNSAITLIALVITIIVLLILAAVTLNIVLGENGIFTKAKNAKEETEKTQYGEELQHYINKQQT